MKRVLGVTALVMMSVTFGACGAKEDAPPVPSEVEAEIAERIAPPGEVIAQGATVQASSGGARSGEEIYQTKCSVCHASGAAGAPKFGDAAAWEPRIGKGMDTLYTNAINGFLGMPPKGLCMDCSDAEIKGTVDYMVKNSQ
jgi:cytochrome c5